MPDPFEGQAKIELRDSLAHDAGGARDTVKFIMSGVDAGSGNPRDMRTLMGEGMGKALFNNPNYTRQQVIDAFGDPDSPNFDAGRASAEINKRLQASDAERERKYGVYKGRQQESEAFTVQDRFLRGEPPDQTRCVVRDGKMICLAQ